MTVFLQVNRWVNPSFIDLSGESFSPSERTKDSQVLCSKAKPKRPRKRKGETDSSDSNSSYLPKETAPRDQDVPWVDRYLPCSKVSIITVNTVIISMKNLVIQ